MVIEEVQAHLKLQTVKQKGEYVGAKLANFHRLSKHY